MSKNRCTNLHVFCYGQNSIPTLLDCAYAGHGGWVLTMPYHEYHHRIVHLYYHPYHSSQLLRLITEVQAEVSHDELNTPEPKEDKWDDFITDLWDVWLPHFRQRGYVYTSTRTHYLEAGNSPAGRGNRSSKILSELIHYSSDTNLLETMENASSIPSLHDSTTTSAGDICLEDHQVSSGEGKTVRTVSCNISLSCMQGCTE